MPFVIGNANRLFLLLLLSEIPFRLHENDTSADPYESYSSRPGDRDEVRPVSLKRKKEMYGVWYEIMPVWVHPGLT